MRTNREHQGGEVKWMNAVQAASCGREEGVRWLCGAILRLWLRRRHAFRVLIVDKYPSRLQASQVA
jgi:hypothetical protein